MKPSFTCCDLTMIARYAHEDLNWWAAQRVRLHLLGCAHCQAKLAQVSGVARLLKYSVGPGPAPRPISTMDRVNRWFRGTALFGGIVAVAVLVFYNMYGAGSGRYAQPSWPAAIAAKIPIKRCEDSDFDPPAEVVTPASGQAASSLVAPALAKKLPPISCPGQQVQKGQQDNAQKAK